MADISSLPRQNSDIVSNNITTPTWYNFFRRLVERISNLENATVSSTTTIVQGSSVERTIVDDSTARTLSFEDSNCLIEFTSASAVTVTVPKDILLDDCNVYFTQGGAGQVTLVAGVGVTIEYSDTLKTRTQESTIGIKQKQTNAFELFGDYEPLALAKSALIRAPNSNGAPAWVAPTADSQKLKQVSGALAWATDTASEIVNVPAGNISATNVQSALDELDTEKQKALVSGTTVLVAGTKVVNTSAVTANSRIMLTVQALGTVTVPKAVGATARTVATSFTITSADATDTSTIAWVLVEP